MLEVFTSLKLTFSVILNVLTCVSHEKYVSLCEVVLIPVFEHRQTLEINISMTAKFVKKHVCKIYRKTYFWFWMHDSFNRYGIHWDYCTCANDLKHIKFCIQKSIAHELWVQHEVY